MVGLEGTLKIIWFQPGCCAQGHLPLDRVGLRPPRPRLAQRPIQPGLDECTVYVYVAD